MGAINQREERTALSLSARMLAEDDWRDVVIGNLSSRGMMLRCDAPPKRNAIIEVRHRNSNVVGRVIWSRDDSCGIYTHITIDASEFTLQTAPTVRSQGPERRVRPRANGYHAVRTQRLSTEESSRIVGRLFDWSVVAFSVVIGAVILADIVQGSLQEPFDKVGYALTSQDSHEAK